MHLPNLSSMVAHKRKTWSIKEELLSKSREAMLSAVQVFNNPNIQFKSETFIVLSNIAWTYLLHAYYRSCKTEYRYCKVTNGRRKFDRTTRGAFKYWELERCLNQDGCPVETIARANLKFLIGLRHEIEHQMTSRIDDYLSARFQACCLNYNTLVKQLFGENYAIERFLTFSIQFSSISEEHVNQLREFTDLPANIASYINAFDETLSEDEFNDSRYAYRVLYVPKLANHRGQADRVFEFIKADSIEAEHINKQYVVIKDQEKKKYLPSQIWKSMQQKGFAEFGAHQHTQLWKAMDAKNPAKGYGVQIANMWYWYEKWLKAVDTYCSSAGNQFQ